MEGRRESAIADLERFRRFNDELEEALQGFLPGPQAEETEPREALVWPREDSSMLGLQEGETNFLLRNEEARSGDDLGAEEGGIADSSSWLQHVEENPWMHENDIKG